MPRRLIRLASMLCALAVASAGHAFAAADKPTYSIDAIRYGTLKDFPVSELVAGADKSRKSDIAMVFWLVRGNGRNILFDAGFYREKFFKDWRPADFRKPSDALRSTGLAPEDITDIVISHMHWDHVDGFDLFPKAHIWIQRDEYNFYAGDAWEKKDWSDGIDGEDVVALVKANTEGRVTLVKGDAQEILPGIICYTGGKHTFQSQYISVNTKDGTFVLASDNMYLYENLDKHAAIGETFDAKSNLAAQDRMRTIASKPQYIIPGHDPAIFERFPKAGDGVVKIE